MIRVPLVFIPIVIVVAQFCGTSLWFATNAVLPQLQEQFHWPPSSLGHLASSVQIGFISGTLLFSMLAIADRFSPSKVYFICSLVCGILNMITLIDPSSFPLMIISRGMVGFFLAGIYPIGMKIASDWKEKGLGHWLGILVGALVLGTAFPYALNFIPSFLKPQELFIAVSILAILGGIIMISFVGDGPYRKPNHEFTFQSIKEIFGVPKLRAPAIGYFGHMWELYAFWVFSPWAIKFYLEKHPALNWSIDWITFLVIASGSLGCIVGGIVSKKIGSAAVAMASLFISGICCVVSPLLWKVSPEIFISFYILWGISVVSDSPQLSALVALNAPPLLKGSSITLVTCIGFGITILSIQLLTHLQVHIPENLFLVLAPGPILGLWAMKDLLQNRT